MGKPIDADDSTAWHEVDEPLTRQQRKLIPHALRESERYSPLLWLKLLQPGTDSVVRCKGAYDHIAGVWFAGFSDVENGYDSGFLVSVTAWAPMNLADAPVKQQPLNGRPFHTHLVIWIRRD